ASQLRVGTPATVTAGSPFNLTVTALDPYGNTDTNYTGTVHFASSDARATLPANYTFTAADAGVHTFNNRAALFSANTQAIEANDTANTTVRGTGTFTVTAAAADHLLVAAPASSTAGTAFTVTVIAQDPYGNQATSYTGTAHFTSSDAAAVLPADYT